MSKPRHLFHSAIIKTNAWCNLNCTYCYMFNLGDKTHESISRDITVDVAENCAKKIGAYVHANDIGKFRVILHGGEPSILPVEQFRHLAARLRHYGKQRVDIAVQTNGYRMPEAFLEVCDRFNISIGISLDGPQAHNDRYRINHSGRGSYGKILANATALAKSDRQRLFGGFLCVVNPEIPVAEFWDWLNILPRKSLNLLWPIEYNQMRPHPDPARLGKWMLDLFRIWFNADDPDVNIPMFYEVVAHALGSKKHSDQMVNDTIDMLVINTDGRIEYPDYFRDKGQGYISSGVNICTGTLDDLAGDSVFNALFSLNKSLPEACENCDVNGVCGGGFVANRVSENASILADLRSRSVMCEGHYTFFSGVRETIRDFLPDAALAS